jgi:hypothetical protein
MVVWWFVFLVDYAYPWEREREQSVKMTFRFWLFIKLHPVFGLFVHEMNKSGKLLLETGQTEQSGFVGSDGSQWHRRLR